MSLTATSAINAYQTLGRTQEAPSSPMAEKVSSFSEMFDRTEAAVTGFAEGKVDTQGVVEALSQTEMALQTAVTVRDQVVSAYQELLRMPL